MVIGEVSIETVISEEPEELWKLTHNDAGISKSEFDQYFRGREKAYAYKLRNPIAYNQGILLEDGKEIIKNIDDEKLPYNKVGISVSKKVGNSVVRSRSKRLISESYRLNREDVKKGYDFVFVARTSINEKKYSDVEAAMINLFKKAGIYIK